MSDISLKEQIAEVKRELQIREWKYPQWVKAGVLSQAEAQQQLERLRAVLATLVELYGKDEPPLPL